MITRDHLFSTVREYVQKGPPDDAHSIYGSEDRKRTAVLAVAEAVMWSAVKQTDTRTVALLAEMNRYCHPEAEATPMPKCLRDQEGGA